MLTPDDQRRGRDGTQLRYGFLLRAPKLWRDGWRWFYTQQHGDNPTYEVVPAP